MQGRKVAKILMACVFGLALVCAGVAGTVAAEGEPASGGVTIKETGVAYNTIQDAIDAVYNATVSSDTTYTIEIAGGTYSAGPIQIKQQEHKSIVLQPAGGASVIFTGSAVVQIDGMGRFDGAESVTIKGITFDYRGAAGDVSCIAAFQVDPAQHHIYAHNIVADGCHFIGTGQASAKVIAVSTPSSGGHAGITLTGCTATNTYILFSGYSTNLTVDECNVATIAGSGINEQSGGNLTVTNSDFDVTKYGIRSGSGHSAPVSGPAIVVNNSSIKASGDAQSDDEAPIVLRGRAPARVQVSHSALINPSHPVIVYNYAGSEFASQFDLALAVNYWESTASAEVGRPVAEMLRNLTLEQAGHDPWYKDVERTQLVSARPVVNETKLTLHDDIGSAIAAAGSGDVITVAAGTYNEKLTIDKAITLKGPNFGINPNTGTRGAEAIIGGEDQDGTILRIESPDVVIDGFTINSSDAGFPVYTGGTVVDGLTISNNIVGTGVRAVTIERSGSNVSILNNTLTGANYGMRVDGPNYVDLKINGNVIYGPITNSVAFSGTSVIEGLEFKNNTLTGRSANIAADIREATVTGNVFTVTEGSYCLNINLHNGSMLSGNTFNGDSDTDGLRLWGTQYDLVPSSDTSIVGNTFNNCPRAITLSPGNSRITIGTNTFSGVTTQVWNAARLNGLYYGIQEAIDAASPDDTINVTAGIFTQNVTIPAGKNGLSLVGAGSSLTTISPPSGRALALLGNISADSPLRPITGIAVEGFTLHSVDLNGFITLSGEPDGEYYTKDLTLRDIVLDGCKYGVLLMSVDGATLDGVVVSNLHGTPETPVSALGLAGVKDLTATNCRFYNNDIAVSVGSTSVESDPAYRYGTNEGITVRWTVFSGNGIAVKNEDQNVSVLATSNYWGTGRTSPVSEIEGKVAFYPWYVSSSMTPQNLSNYVAPDDGPGGGGGPTTPPVQPPVIAGAVSQPVETTTGGTVALEDNSAKVELPPEAVPENVTVTLGLVTEMEQPTTGMIMIGNKVYEITAETEDGELVTQFQKPLTLTFTFAEEELEEAGTSAEDLMVFYWDAKAQAWIALPTTVDPVTGTVTAITDHFTVFALMAKPDMPALPDTKGHWAETHVLRLVSLGIVSGYEDGTFRPETGITREEFAKMVVLAAGLEPVAEPELGFSDADEIQGWARGYVAAAVEAGIITGLPENRFGPGERVTRQQAATMIGRALGVEVGAAGTPTSFVDDGDIESWALAALNLAVEKGLITGFPDNSFKPAENVTRAQAATMLAKLTVVRLAD
jgi:nitrous oxidase accessory protein NosD